MSFIHHIQECCPKTIRLLEENCFKPRRLKRTEKGLKMEGNGTRKKIPLIENPRNWHYTWEAQSQLPILKLFLFSHTFNPSLQCKDLQVQLKFETSLLTVSWTGDAAQVFLAVPVPKVLVDLESPVNFRALDDHIDVKVTLLLPVDHPIVSGFVSDMYCEVGNGIQNPPSSYFSKPLVLESDAERLATNGESDFYCRNCQFKLTERPIRSFVEMPSVDWREAADNWFGNCCCSFGGISEKMVATFAKSHVCREGSCLLSTTSIILYQDDLVRFNTPDHHYIREHDDSVPSETTSNCDNCQALSSSVISKDRVVHNNNDKLNSVMNHGRNNASSEEPIEQNGYHNEKQTSIHLPVAINAASNDKCCSHSPCESFSKDQELMKAVDLSMYQKLLLNGYLGNIFMFKSSGLSKDVDWVAIECPKCSSLLGAYPSVDGDKPIDGGIRLLKCYISTSSADLSGDVFRKYTLERMFSGQLMENADDELSFRTAVKDLQTKSLQLQMVLLNPDSWHCNGSCKEGSVELAPSIYLHPVIKVLFSVPTCSNDSLSSLHQKQRKDQEDEVFMLDMLVKHIQRSLESSSSTLPPSLTSLQGYSLSVLRR